MKARRFVVMAVAGVVSLAVSYAIYTALVWAMDFLWQAEEGALWPEGPPAWFVLLLPFLAGVGVYLIRSRAANGHSPLLGLQLAAVSGREYPGLLGAIVVTMVCGVALGPEAALLTTGGFVGGIAATRLGVPEERAVGWAGLWAVAALFLGPLLSGTFDVSQASGGYTFQWIDFVLAVAAALLAAAVLALVRFVAVQLDRVERGGNPVLWLSAGAGLAIGASGLAYRAASGESVAFAMTSGEQMIRPLIALGAIGPILLAVAAKSIIYALALGSGFRGGAYFPAMFVGAGCGAVLAMQFDGSVGAGAAAGIVAAVVYLAHPNWVGVIILGAAVGYLTGGVALLPVALVAAAVGKLIPRVDPPAHEAPEPSPDQAAAAA